ncbi:hypothetical protein BH10PSE14_BH10PSE14_09990 [soil metagenome]
MRQQRPDRGKPGLLQSPRPQERPGRSQQVSHSPLRRCTARSSSCTACHRASRPTPCPCNPCRPSRPQPRTSQPPAPSPSRSIGRPARQGPESAGKGAGCGSRCTQIAVRIAASQFTVMGNVGTGISFGCSFDRIRHRHAEGRVQVVATRQSPGPARRESTPCSRDHRSRHSRNGVGRHGRCVAHAIMTRRVQKPGGRAQGRRGRCPRQPRIRARRLSSAADYSPRAASQSRPATKTSRWETRTD